MIFKADEATYDASGRSVRETRVSDVGRGILLVRGDELTVDSIAFRIVDGVVHLQSRTGDGWLDAPLMHD